jgi:hypothetical protein
MQMYIHFYSYLEYGPLILTGVKKKYESKLQNRMKHTFHNKTHFFVHPTVFKILKRGSLHYSYLSKLVYSSISNGLPDVKEAYQTINNRFLNTRESNLSLLFSIIIKQCFPDLNLQANISMYTNLYLIKI